MTSQLFAPLTLVHIDPRCSDPDHQYYILFKTGVLDTVLRRDGICVFRIVRARGTAEEQALVQCMFTTADEGVENVRSMLLPVGILVELPTSPRGIDVRLVVSSAVFFDEMRVRALASYNSEILGGDCVADITDRYPQGVRDTIEMVRRERLKALGRPHSTALCVSDEDRKTLTLPSFLEEDPHDPCKRSDDESETDSEDDEREADWQARDIADINYYRTSAILCEFRPELLAEGPSAEDAVLLTIGVRVGNEIEVRGEYVHDFVVMYQSNFFREDRPQQNYIAGTFESHAAADALLELMYGRDVESVSVPVLCEVATALDFVDFARLFWECHKSIMVRARETDLSALLNMCYRLSGSRGTLLSQLACSMLADQIDRCGMSNLMQSVTCISVFVMSAGALSLTKGERECDMYRRLFVKDAPRNLSAPLLSKVHSIVEAAGRITNSAMAHDPNCASILNLNELSTGIIRSGLAAAMQ